MSPESDARRLFAQRRWLMRVTVRIVSDSAATVHRRPSQKVRIAAAQVRVKSDQWVHRSTPQWIVDLANSKPNDCAAENARAHTSSTMGPCRWWRS